MIDKKRLFKSLTIISLIIIIIFIAVQIRKTLARYETTGKGKGDVDVAFWVVGTTFQTENIAIDNIYPSDTPFEYTFSVSNFNEEGKRAETDLEYDITIKTSTYLPLSYEIVKEDADGAKTVCVKDDQLHIDVDDTYYRIIKIETTQNNFTMDCDSNKTDTFTIKVTFPKEYSTNTDYADLIENIKIELSARQIIGE